MPRWRWKRRAACLPHGSHPNSATSGPSSFCTAAATRPAPTTGTGAGCATYNVAAASPPRWCCTRCRPTIHSRPRSTTPSERSKRWSNDGTLRPGEWILGGDSAGGGLALATAQALRDRGGPQAAGLLLTAPWVDLAMEHPDMVADQRPKFVMGREIAENGRGAVRQRRVTR